MGVEMNVRTTGSDRGLRLTLIVFVAATVAACAATPSGGGAGAPPPTDWNEVEMPAHVFAEHAAGMRRDSIAIPLAPGEELEYKLELDEGASIVYSWEAEGLPDASLLYSEFHGHTERVGDAPGLLMFYRKATGASENGTLVAPFTGIHGWYLVNSADVPITVQLEVAGFYRRTDL